MKRRTFLKASLATTALAGFSGAAVEAAAADSGRSGGREYYELRTYRLKAGADHALLDGYLENAALPALGRLGLKPIGVFTELEPKDPPALHVLIPYPTLESFATSGALLQADPEYLKAGATYLQTAKSDPAFERIDSWLLLAFIGMPKIEMAAFSREKKPRIFELRTYESHSEAKAIQKVAMFNAGEIDVMREVGLAPVFYGQALVGRDLPHLTYMVSGEDREAHKKHWGGFGNHAVWKKLKDDPQYADTVSKITTVFLAPTPYSQI